MPKLRQTLPASALDQATKSLAVGALGAIDAGVRSLEVQRRRSGGGSHNQDANDGERVASLVKPRADGAARPLTLPPPVLIFFCRAVAPACPERRRGDSAPPAVVQEGSV